MQPPEVASRPEIAKISVAEHQVVLFDLCLNGEVSDSPPGRRPPDRPPRDACRVDAPGASSTARAEDLTSETTSKADDNMDSIRKRFALFKSESLPVLDLFKSKGLLRRRRAQPRMDSAAVHVAQLAGVPE